MQTKRELVGRGVGGMDSLRFGIGWKVAIKIFQGKQPNLYFLTHWDEWENLFGLAWATTSNRRSLSIGIGEVLG